MPLYDYRCEACGHEWEDFGRMDETPPCPACGCARVTRPLSPVPTIYKGGGWTLKSTAGNDPGKRKAGGWE